VIDMPGDASGFSADGRCRDVVGDNGAMHERRIPVWVAALADLVVILVFVAIGRRSHDEGGDTAGFVRVAWPFVVGLGVGWIASGLWRAALAWRRAVIAWLVTVAVGMALRIVVQGHELKPTFVVVALVFVGVCMLGWRAAAAAWSRRAARRPLA
jgi:hypothetical protein